MATPKEIIDDVLGRGVHLRPSLIDSVENIPALTDQLADNKILDFYGTNGFFEEADYNDDALIPDLEYIAKAAGEKSVDKFIENFPTKIDKYKKNIVADSKLGKRGWETAKKMWQQASLDKMHEDMVKGYEAGLRGDLGAGGGPLSGILPEGVESAIADASFQLSKLFTPRRKEAFLRGEDPTWQDNLGDAAESGLYLVPGSGYAGFFGKLASKLPKIGKIISVPFKNDISSAFIGNAMAPLLAETVDAATRGDDDPNVERRDFNPGDVILGTMTNLGVNKVLTGALSRILNTTTGERFGTKIRDLIYNIGKSTREAGENGLSRAKDIVKKGYLGDNTMSASELIGKGKETSIANEAAWDAARNMVKFGDIVDYLTPISKKGAKDLISKTSKIIAGDIDKSVAARGAPVDDVVEYIVSKIPEGMKDQAKVTVQKVLEGPYRYDAMNLLMGRKGMTSADRIDDLIRMGLPTWGVNKFGGEREADYAASSLSTLLPGLGPALKKYSAEKHEESRQNAARSDIEDVKKLRKNELDDRDVKYLDAVASKPSILTTGYSEAPDDFKIWLLERGHNLLRGTKAHRPLWEVK